MTAANANTSLDTLNGVLAHSFEAVITVGPDGRIVFFNGAAERLFDYTAEDVLGRELDLLIPDRYRGRHGQFLEAFRAAPEDSRVMGRTGEIPARRRDGSEFVAEGTISKLTSDDVTYFTAILRDVSRRWAADQRLRMSEEKHRAIVDSAPDAILVADARTGRIREANATAGEMFGCAPDELVGLHQGELHPIGERARHERIFREHIENHRIHVPDASIQRADGSILPVAISARPTEIAGEPVLVGFFRDIRHRKQWEAELARARDEAQAANRAKSEFLASMSHELRTPLNGILGFADMIRNEIKGPLGDPDYAAYAGHIQASGQYLLQTIEQILDHSRLESGRYTLNETRFEIADVIAECAAMVQPSAEAGEIALALDTPADLPALHADRHAVKQVVTNLLGNAVKFTRPGGRITIRARRAADGGLLLAVADTGIGIPEERQSEIFERFEQGPNAHATTRKGTGLGLAVARNLMALHDGDLTLESAVGEGTTVTARFPPERLTAG